MPDDGSLPESVRFDPINRTFSAYVHIPFCRVRCGYCDFNTYTAEELRGVSQSSYISELEKEISLSRDVLKNSGVAPQPLHSVFFGGGTPTLLPAEDLIEALTKLNQTFGIAQGAEVTVEANPDSVDERYFEKLVEGGFTRISFGVQSASQHVLDTLDRTHDTRRVPEVVRAASRVGLETSIDLIYGTPGETLHDWQETLDFAVNLETGHISAYALIIEQGTALERQIKRGEISEPDDDLTADKYELADQYLEDAGFRWYEVSNWAKSTQQQSQHNLAYWTGRNWWGYGPGSHSHIGGARFWNHKHPAVYAQRLKDGRSPAAAYEVPSPEETELEQLLLGSRLSRGIDITEFEPQQILELVQEGLIDEEEALRGQLILTLKGRLLADYVVRRLS